MNSEKTKKKKVIIEIITVGLIIVIGLFLYMSNLPQTELAAAAANARTPLGDVFKVLLNKYF